MDNYFQHYDHMGYAIIEILIGKLNLFDTPKVLNQFEKTLEQLQYPDVIVDLKNVTHIDSVGIGFLISIKNVTEKHGKELLVVCNNEIILKVFSITKMNQFFKIFNTINEAVKTKKDV